MTARKVAFPFFSKSPPLLFMLLKKIGFSSIPFRIESFELSFVNG
jgi:hypothetical protein